SHGQGVFDRQRAGAAKTGANAGAVDAAGENLDDILAEGGDAGLDLGLGAIADADHRDNRPDADDDAQHGENRPQLVPAQRAESGFEDDEIAHGQKASCAALCSSCRRRNSASAIKRLATGVSLTTWPSRMTTIRLVYWATSSSWVTMTMVMPWSLSFWNTPMMSALVRVSRLPVGSSARSRAGWLESARAIATRCCWPPESWFGLWSARSARPTVSSAFKARSRWLEPANR